MAPPTSRRNLLQSHIAWQEMTNERLVYFIFCLPGLLLPWTDPTNRALFLHIMLGQVTSVFKWARSTLGNKVPYSRSFFCRIKLLVFYSMIKILGINSLVTCCITKSTSSLNLLPQNEVQNGWDIWLDKIYLYFAVSLSNFDQVSSCQCIAIQTNKLKCQQSKKNKMTLDNVMLHSDANFLYRWVKIIIAKANHKFLVIIMAMEKWGHEKMRIWKELPTS